MDRSARKNTSPRGQRHGGPSSEQLETRSQTRPDPEAPLSDPEEVAARAGGGAGGRQVDIPMDVLDSLIVAAGGPSKVGGPDGLLRQITAALMNRALEAEMTEHLGFERGAAPPDQAANRRNGHRGKTVRSNSGNVEIAVPRDRDGTFEPRIIPKHRRSLGGFDDQILSMYARGMTTREIEDHVREMYGVDVSPDLVSRVTEAIIDELREWQSRPLDEVYPIIYVDALVVKIRDKGTVENKSIYVVMGVDTDGGKNVLGLWVQRTEGAKFWLSILSELRTRGVKDVLILCADGLSGMPEAVAAAFPKAIFQTCVVHLIRASTRYVPYKDLRAVCADLRLLYTAESVDTACARLEEFSTKWGEKYPYVVRAWRTRLEEWTPFLAYPPEIRRAVYTTNAIEALNRQLRKTLKTRGPLPTDDAALKLIYLAIRNAQKRAGRMAREWSVARTQFAILFADRWPDH